MSLPTDALARIRAHSLLATGRELLWAVYGCDPQRFDADGPDFLSLRLALSGSPIELQDALAGLRYFLGRNPFQAIEEPCGPRQVAFQQRATSNQGVNVLGGSDGF